jgi:hypothetical protein
MRTEEASRPVDEADSLSRKFPSVRSLSIRLDFTTPQQQPLDQETRAYESGDECDFTATCPGRCGGQGTFDFGPKVASIISSKQASGEARGTCQQPVFPDSGEMCGIRLVCAISVSYLPE